MSSIKFNAAPIQTTGAIATIDTPVALDSPDVPDDFGNNQLQPMVTSKSNQLQPMVAEQSASASVPDFDNQASLMAAYPGTPTAGMTAGLAMIQAIPAKVGDGEAHFPKLLKGLVDHGLLQLLDNGLVTNYDSEAAATCLVHVIDQVLHADPELKVAEGLATSVQHGMLLTLAEVGKTDGMDDVLLSQLLNTTVSMIQSDPEAVEYFKEIDDKLMAILTAPSCSEGTVLAIQQFVDDVQVAGIDLEFKKTNGALAHSDLLQAIIAIVNFKDSDDAEIAQALAALKGMSSDPDFVPFNMTHGGVEALIDLIKFKSKKAILSAEEVDILTDALGVLGGLLRDPVVIPTFAEQEGMKVLKSCMAVHHATEPIVSAVMQAFVDLAATPEGKQKLYASGAWVTITEILNKHPEYAGVIQQYGGLLATVPPQGPVFPTLLQELVHIGLLPLIQDGLVKNYKSPDTVRCLMGVIDQVAVADPKLNIAVGLAYQNAKGINKSLAACARYKNMDVPVLAKILQTVVTLANADPEAMDYYTSIDGMLAKVLKQKPLPDGTIPVIRDFMAKIRNNNIDLKLNKTEAMLNELETPLVMSSETRLKLEQVATGSAGSDTADAGTPPSGATPGGDFTTVNYHERARKNTDNPNYKVTLDGMEDDTKTKEEIARMNEERFIFNRFHVRSLTLHIPMFIYATCALPLWWMDQGVNSHSFHSGWSLSRLSLVLIWLASLLTIFEQILEIMDHKQTMHSMLESNCRPLLQRMYLIWICLFLYLSGAFLYFCSGCIVAIAYNEIGIYENEAVAGMWWTEMCFIGTIAAFLGFDIWIHVWTRWEVRVTSILIIYAFFSLIAMVNAYKIGTEHNVTGTGYLLGFIFSMFFLFHRLMLAIRCCTECIDYSRCIEMMSATLILVAVFVTVLGYLLYGSSFEEWQFLLNYMGYAQFQAVFGVIIAMDLFFSEYMVLEKGCCQLVVTKDEVTSA